MNRSNVQRNPWTICQVVFVWRLLKDPFTVKLEAGETCFVKSCTHTDQFIGGGNPPTIITSPTPTTISRLWMSFKFFFIWIKKRTVPSFKDPFGQFGFHIVKSPPELKEAFKLHESGGKNWIPLWTPETKQFQLLTFQTEKIKKYILSLLVKEKTKCCFDKKLFDSFQKFQKKVLNFNNCLLLVLWSNVNGLSVEDSVNCQKNGKFQK